MNAFEKRLKNDLFPAPPASFSAAVRRGMDLAGIRKQPRLRAVPFAAVMAASVVLITALMLFGSLNSRRQSETAAASPVQGSSSATGQNASVPLASLSPDWSGNTRVFAFTDPDGRITPEDTGRWGRSILSFLRECGESEPEELWILRARAQLQSGAEQTPDYLVLAQSKFLPDDGPDLYLISGDADGGVVWGTQDGSSWPVRVRLQTGEKTQWALFGSNPLTKEESHITRGVIEGDEPGTDVVFSVYLSTGESRAPFQDSRYFDQLREYWLTVIGQEDLDRTLRLETYAGDHTYKVIRKLIPEMQAVTPPGLDPVRPDAAGTVRSPGTDVVNLSSVSKDAAESFADAILSWLKGSGTEPDALWICAAKAAGEKGGTYVLAMYEFDGETGPELFFLENGTVRWQTYGYDPFRINTVYDPQNDQLCVFGFCAYVRGIETGHLTFLADKALTSEIEHFVPELPLDEIQKRLSGLPHAEWMSQFFLYPVRYSPGLKVRFLSFTAEDGRTYPLTTGDENRLSVLSYSPGAAGQ